MSENDLIEMCIGCGRDTSAKLTTRYGTVVCKQCYNELRGQGHVRIEGEY